MIHWKVLYVSPVCTPANTHARECAKHSFCHGKATPLKLLDLGKNIYSTKERRCFRSQFWTITDPEIVNGEARNMTSFVWSLATSFFMKYFTAPGSPYPLSSPRVHYGWKVTRDKHFGPNVCFCYGFSFLNRNVLWINVHGNSSRQIGNAWHIMCTSEALISSIEKKTA